jgi:hypothetical protein
MRSFAILILIYSNISDDTRLWRSLSDFENFLLNIMLCLRNDRFRQFYTAVCHNDNDCQICHLFVFSSSSLFIIIEDDDDCICSMRKSIAVFRSKEIWNVSCIFINCDKSNWQTSFKTFLILYDSIHLWFNFLKDRSILMFLMNNQIMSSNSYSDEDVFFNSCVFFACFVRLLISSWWNHKCSSSCW